MHKEEEEMYTYLRFTKFSAFLLLLSAVCLLALPNGAGRPGPREWHPDKNMLAGLLDEVPVMVMDGEFSLMEGAGGEVNGVVLPPDKVRAAMAETSESEDEYFRVLGMLKGGRLEDGEKALNAFLAKNPDHSDAWRQLGDCCYNLGKIDAAINAYKTALRKKPGNYLAKRGQGVAALYLGYEFFEQDNPKLAHRYFQQSLQCLHECLENNGTDQLAAYGQALAAEGVSRELYRIAQKSLKGDNEETAKNIIRNCLDILDVAVTATEDRLTRRPDDSDAKMLLGGLFLRRARMLQPFGHIEEASGNLVAAMKAYDSVIKSGGAHIDSAKAQSTLCSRLISEWNAKKINN